MLEVGAHGHGAAPDVDTRARRGGVRRGKRKNKTFKITDHTLQLNQRPCGQVRV